MITSHPRRDPWRFFWVTLFAILLVTLLFGWSAQAQYLTPYSPPALPSPYLSPSLPSTTYILPPPPPPRVEYPPLYSPPAPMVVCRPFGTATICQ